MRAKITGLPTNTPLYYRFTAGRDISAVGRSKTMPSATAVVAQMKFAWFTCQDWSINHWGAMSLLAAEDLDFIVHVGDYIYETVGAAFQSARPSRPTPRWRCPTARRWAAPDTRRRWPTTATCIAPTAATRASPRCTSSGR